MFLAGRPRRDAEAIKPQALDQGGVQQEVLDADAADARGRRPQRERDTQKDPVPTKNY